MDALPIARSDVEAVLAPLERARSLPAVAYHDPQVLAYERDAIFARSWLCAGREEDVAHPGAWVRAPLTPEGILVVRGDDLTLRAFYNVCPHRGAPLVDAPAGRSRELRCPYHGLRYSLAGRPCDAEGAAMLAPAARGLTELRVEAWQGFVFVTEDAAAAPLAAYQGAVPEWLREAPLAEARRVHRAEYVVAANWKLLAQNFQESHHFTRVHPALERLTPNARACTVLPGGKWLAGTMELADGVETVSTSAGRNGRPFLASPRYRRQVSDALLFPTLLTSLQPDYLLTYRLHPEAPDRTRVVAETFVHPAALGGAGGASDVVGFWETVNAEDRWICEQTQIGVRSRGYVTPGYAAAFDGVHAFDSLVARAYLG